MIFLVESGAVLCKTKFTCCMHASWAPDLFKVRVAGCSKTWHGGSMPRVACSACDCCCHEPDKFAQRLVLSRPPHRYCVWYDVSVMEG